MTSPTQKGEREEALSEIDLDALITTWECNPHLLGFRDAVLSCLRELKASRSSAKAEGEMREALEALRTALLPDAMAKEKGALTAASRERCMAIVKRALTPKEGA